MYEPPDKKAIGHAIDLLSGILLQCEYESVRNWYRVQMLELLEPRMSGVDGVVKHLRHKIGMMERGSKLDSGEDLDTLKEVYDTLGGRPL